MGARGDIQITILCNKKAASAIFITILGNQAGTCLIMQVKEALSRIKHLTLAVINSDGEKPQFMKRKMAHINRY
jgi:hypothetical protein